MLVTGKEILNDARKNGYAVGAFNVVNMEMAQAVVRAAEYENSPVIIQTTEGALEYAGVSLISKIVKKLAKGSNVPVALHLDHGKSLEVAMQCIRSGYTSVMIDGSHLSLNENIFLAARVAEVAHACNVSVEAELGRLGGIEDNVNVSKEDEFFTDPDEAITFVKETEIDYLAIAIGTAHGKYKGIPKLDFDRLEIIKKSLEIPIVLHGASGVSEKDIKKAIKLGINKINIDTDLRVAFTDKIKEIIALNPDEFDIRKIFAPARENVIETVRHKIKLFGSSGKY
ncbi:MAG: class II fructose-1,6-bisphosphate aldolase [Clostridiales bacterium]|nr:class II fructose-1,6-bisphosphate aldolase [Clostridiales bacterium]